MGCGAQPASSCNGSSLGDRARGGAYRQVAGGGDDAYVRLHVEAGEYASRASGAADMQLIKVENTRSDGVTG